MKPTLPLSSLGLSLTLLTTIATVAIFSVAIAAKLALAAVLLSICVLLVLLAAERFEETLENVALYHDSKTYESIHSFSSILFWVAVRSVAKLCAIGLGIFLSLCAIWHLSA